ncbi:MAG TPA: hypothetical protein VGK45_15075 [Thermoanaerobaculia bacterium]
MPRIHPKSEILEGPAGDLPDVRRRIEDHLRSCPICAARCRAQHPVQPMASRDRQVLAWRPPASQASDYDAVLQRVLDAFQPRRQKLPSDLRQAEELAALGLLLAEGLGGDGMEAGTVEDLRACGWTLTATVRRAAFDLPAAELLWGVESPSRRCVGCAVRTDNTSPDEEGAHSALGSEPQTAGNNPQTTGSELRRPETCVAKTNPAKTCPAPT